MLQSRKQMDWGKQRAEQANRAFVNACHEKVAADTHQCAISPPAVSPVGIHHPIAPNSCQLPTQKGRPKKACMCACFLDDKDVCSHVYRVLTTKGRVCMRKLKIDGCIHGVHFIACIAAITAQSSQHSLSHGYPCQL